MALRKHQITRGHRAIHTPEGFVHKLSSRGSIIPPPDDQPYIAWGSYWAGPLILSGGGVGGGTNPIRSLTLNLDQIQFYPMYEGMQDA